MAGGFIFDTSKGETPETVARKRALADAIMGRIGSRGANNVGEGIGNALSSIGQGIQANVLGRRADSAAAAGQAEGNSVFNSLISSMTGGAGFPSSVAAGASPTSAAATGTKTYSPNGTALRDGIIETAKAIGADPLDLATAISYETGGTFDPLKKGPTTKYGQHRGLIQFGEPQAQQHGVNWGDPLGSQLGANGAVANYFRSSGFKPGMSGLDLYSTINAGSPGRYSASDENNGGAKGNVADKWNNQMGGHRQKALALLGGGSQGVDYTPTNSIPAQTPQQAIQSVSPVADPDGLFAPGADVTEADLAFARQATGPEAPASGGATFGGPELVYDGKGMRYVDEGAQRAANPPMPYNGVGASIDGYAAPTPAQANFNDRWSAGAVDPTQTASIPGATPPPAQMQPQGGPSPELLRQNDMMLGGALAPQGQAPQQAANTSGFFPAAPSQNAPQQVPQQSNDRLQSLMRAASNPWVQPEQRAIINTLIQQEMQNQDPLRQLQMRKLQGELNAAPERKTTTINGNLVDTQNGQVIANFPDQVKPTGDMQEYEYAKQQGYQGSFADYQQSMKKAGANSTNVTVGEGDKFYEALDKKNADTFAALSDTGIQARSKLAQIERLGGLMQASPSGATAALKLAAGEYGLKTEGLDDLQATQALINELVPQQRQPGSGPMSDADLALFKQSLPRIINTADGNSLILDTMRGITQYQMQMGDIADRVANREISAAKGRDEIKNLKNPLEGFRTSTKDKSDNVPSGVDKTIWDVMTPEERALWQN